MTLGVSKRLGSGVLGSFSLNADTPAFIAPADIIAGIIEDLTPSSPFVQLFSVQTPSGATFRFCDYLDPDDNSYLGDSTVYRDPLLEITYNRMKVGRPRYEMSLDGRQSSIAFSVEDPLRLILNYALLNSNLEGAKLIVVIQRADASFLEDIRFIARYFLQSVSSDEDPDKINFVLGTPNLFDKSFPPIVANRANCHNIFGQRYEHLTERISENIPGENYCNYPSDEFDEQTSQYFRAAADTETELLYGWYVQNGSKPDFARAPLGFGQNTLEVQMNAATTDFDDTNKRGWYAYKKIPDPNFDLDVRAWVSKSGPDYGHAALLIIDADAPTNWIFFGESDLSGNPNRLFRRWTISGVSSEAHIAMPTASREFRIVRTRTGSDDAWYFRSCDPSLPNSTHNTHAILSAGTLNMGSNLLVGFVLAAEGITAQDIEGNFKYLRFFAGGYQTCNYTSADCAIRKNLHQRNAYVGLPDGLLSFF